jgi:hypothetical protein
VAKTNGKKPTKSAPAKKAAAKAAAPKPAPEATMPYLTSIEVSGFKCLVKPTKVELGPLTVLAGANSSGKSSIMQPLLLMKQTLESPFNVAGPFDFSGPNVTFTDANQFLSTTRGMRGGLLRISLTTFDPMVVKEDDLFHSSLIMGAAESGISIEYRQDTSGRLVVLKQVTKSGGIETSLQPGLPPSFSIDALTEDKARQFEKSLLISLTGRSSQSDGTPLFPVEVIGGPFIRVKHGFYILQGYANETLNPIILNMLHIPGLRGNPERSYKYTSFIGPFKGVFHSYVATIVKEWMVGDAGRMSRLATSLKEVGVATKVSAKEVNQSQVEILVQIGEESRKGGHAAPHSIADVGIGVSQVLPFLVALIAAEPGQMVYCEQPELHLHPRAQYRLAGVMVDAMKRGVRIVVETHSALLLTALQTAVAKGELPPDDLKLYWFSRDKNGHAKATKAELDSRGRYNDWPVDFGDVEIEAVNNFLDAAQAQIPGVAS